MGLLKPAKFFPVWTIGGNTCQIAFYRPVDQFIYRIEQLTGAFKTATGRRGVPCMKKIQSCYYRKAVGIWFPFRNSTFCLYVPEAVIAESRDPDLFFISL
jgi:hypothetical protein